MTMQGANLPTAAFDAVQQPNGEVPRQPGEEQDPVKAKLVDKIRKAVELAKSGDPDAFGGGATEASVGKAIEDYAGLKQAVLLRMVTQGLKLGSLAEALHLYCSDLVVISDGHGAKVERRMPSKPILEERDVPRSASKEAGKGSNGNGNGDGVGDVVKNAVIEKLRRAVESAKVADPLSFFGLVPFAQVSSAIDRHGGVTSDDLARLVMQGLSMTNTAEALRTYCGDLVSIEVGSEFLTQQAPADKLNTDIVPRPQEPVQPQVMAEPVKIPQGLTPHEIQVIEHIRAAVEIAKDADPSSFQGEVSYKQVLLSIQQHAGLGAGNLINLMQTALNIDNPATAFQLHCGDLVHIRDELPEPVATSSGDQGGSGQSVPEAPEEDPVKGDVVKQKLLIKLRRAVQAAIEGDPQSFDDEVSLDYMVKMIEDYAGLKKVVLLRLITHGIGIANPADAFRRYCADIVKVSDKVPKAVKTADAGPSASAGQGTSVDDPVKLGLIDKLRKAVQIAKEADPIGCAGGISADQIATLIENYTGLKKTVLLRMVTHGLGLANLPEALRLHCADIVGITDPQDDLQDDVAADDQRMFEQTCRIDALNSVKKKLVEKLRKALELAKQADAMAFFGEVSAERVSQSLEMHAGVKQAVLDRMVTQGLNVPSVAKALRMYCADLVSVASSEGAVQEAAAADRSAGGEAVITTADPVKNKLIEKLRRAVMTAKESDPLLFDGDVSFKRVVEAIELHTGLKKAVFNRMVTTGLNVATPLEALRTHCCDLVSVTDSGEDDKSFEELLKNLRDAIELAKDADPMSFFGEVTFDEVATAIEQHAGLAKDEITRLVTHGLKVRRPADALRMYCSDLLTLAKDADPSRKRGLDSASAHPLGLQAKVQRQSGGMHAAAMRGQAAPSD